MPEMGYVLFRRKGRHRRITNGIGYLADQLRANITSGKESWYAGLHAIVGNEMAADVVFGMIFQKISIGFETDEYKHPLSRMLPSLVRLAIMQSYAIHFGVSLNIIDNRVPDDFNFRVLGQLVL